MIEFGKYAAYALYRLPFRDEVHIVCQHSLEGTVCMNPELGAEDCRAFVMLPFDGVVHPVVRIRPDDEITIKTDMLKIAEDGKISDIEDNKERYREVFESFHRVIPSQFEKLVLSRSVSARYDGRPMDAFLRACDAYPRTMVYLCYTPETGYWIGSTPEILLAGSKSHYCTVALAGTMLTDGEWSDKNKMEQSLVADYVRDVITPLSRVVEEAGPYTSRAGNLYHLKTEFHFSPLPSVKVIDFVNRLNPTPAVCGLPKNAAKAFIVENEGYDRSYYSGVVGMLDVHGETNLYVNLRCCNLYAEDDHYRCKLYAGGGILPESTTETEFQETEEKLKTICSVLNPIYSN
jgi:isochorismate synthase